MARLWTAAAARWAAVLLFCLIIAPIFPPLSALITFLVALAVGWRAARDRAAFDAAFFRANPSAAGLGAPTAAALWLLLRALFCAVVIFLVFASLRSDLLAARAVSFALLAALGAALVGVLDRRTGWDGARLSYFRGPLLYGATFYGLSEALAGPARTPLLSLPFEAIERGYERIGAIAGALAGPSDNLTAQALEWRAYVNSFGGLLDQEWTARLLRDYAAAGDALRAANAGLKEAASDLLSLLAASLSLPAAALQTFALLASINVLFGYVIAAAVAALLGRSSRRRRL